MEYENKRIELRRAEDREREEMAHRDFGPSECAIHSYRLETLEKNFSEYLIRDEKWKEDIAIKIEEKLARLDTLIVEIETSKKLGRWLIGIAAAVGALLTGLINVIHSFWTHVQFVTPK